MKNWLEHMDEGAQRLPACSQEGFPARYCTCKVCSALRRQDQGTVLMFAENADPELLRLYRLVVVPVG